MEILNESHALKLREQGELWTAAQVAEFHGVKPRTVLTWKQREKLLPVWDGHRRKSEGEATVLDMPLYDPAAAQAVSPRGRSAPQG